MHYLSNCVKIQVQVESLGKISVKWEGELLDKIFSNKVSQRPHWHCNIKKCSLLPPWQLQEMQQFNGFNVNCVN